MISKIVILDGYTDEPAGLGVPPYINTYPRLVAGAVWNRVKDADIKYWTIDDARRNFGSFIKQARESQLLVVIGGAEVPGKYLGGKPLSIQELETILLLTRDVNRILIGPAASHGFGGGGGNIAVETGKLRNLFTEIVRGDPEIYIDELMQYGFEKARPWLLREDYELADKAFRLGAKIVLQHPNYGRNLVVEIETYRGCSRWITGGCSFCIEPRHGRPLMRSLKGIIEEVEALYRLGVRHIRLGKQPDILAYMARDIGKQEFPRPDPEVIERLFQGIRNVAPGLITLHIDNVNPGTIVHYPEESIRILKTIVKYHTPGDVAALGIESFDEKVVNTNNLKVYPDEALEAIRLINRIGRERGWNGMPHLLPGINLIYGLPGESRNTYRMNLEYLTKIIREGLMVRRLNIRRVAVLENTPLWLRRDEVEYLLKKYRDLYRFHRVRVMQLFDKIMLKRILPPGTILYYLIAEKKSSSHTMARFPGSYPIAVKIKGEIPLWSILAVRVKGYSAKSVSGEPISLRNL
ncbi:radical SAM protein [Desulfurococcus amylolyticus]|uniref:Radical SAM domain protein n=1 Tax=Desulfurococcus amylolyticus DSM 16532 TaxID=768672 RepID=I3XS25_DESAM|nr:radical SAM protein [Desulfurococcus amylolyticus]AFL66749.1 Radical SAM domain protein [Desulfurococcus amylolyticus DSM 16532]